MKKLLFAALFLIIGLAACTDIFNTDHNVNKTPLGSGDSNKIASADIDFGTLKLGETKKMATLFDNLSDSTLTIYSYRIEGMKGYDVQVSMSVLPLILQPRAKFTYLITVAPTSLGKFTAYIVFVTSRGEIRKSIEYEAIN